MKTEIRKGIKLYTQGHCFRPATEWIQPDAWHRPLRLPDDEIDRAESLTSYNEIGTRNSYNFNKVLFAINEQASVFLPDRPLTRDDWREFWSYTDRERMALGQSLRVPLEDAVFGFLDSSIERRTWTPDELIDTLVDAVREDDEGKVGLVELINRMERGDVAVRAFLINKGADFLTEGSAMARVLGGSFGPIQSSLVRVFMDEYGRGALEAKHSSLFRNSMASCGLKAHPHAHFESYLPSALMMANYFHAVCSSPAHVFDYFGAMYYAEATTTRFFEKLVPAFRKAFGGRIDLDYFEEHIEVDQDHRRIVLDEVIRPAIATYGMPILHDIYRGFEIFRRLVRFSSTDIVEQAAFSEAVLTDRQPVATATGPAARRRLHAAQRSFRPEIADENLHLRVENGALEFGTGTGDFVVLAPGRAVTIPRGRLFRMRPTPESDCDVEVQPATAAAPVIDQGH